MDLERGEPGLDRERPVVSMALLRPRNSRGEVGAPRPAGLGRPQPPKPRQDAVTHRTARIMGDRAFILLVEYHVS